MSSAFFNGRLLVSPATASKVDDSQLFSRGLSVGNVLAIIGSSEGGQPTTPLRFSSAADARATLISGELLHAIELAFNPSAETGAPDVIIALRVNPALQSGLTLADTNSGSAIDLVSTNYGLTQNQIKTKVEAGTNLGTKITTQNGNDFYVGDDIYRKALSIGYIGAAAVATVTVTNTTVTVTKDGADTVAPLATYPTIAALVDFLNTIAGITALVLDGNGLKPSLNGLDAVTTVNIKNLTPTLRGDLQAQVDWYNSIGEGFVTATRHAGATLPAAAVPFTYLSGGTNGSIITGSWTDCLTALQGEDAQWVVALSSSSAVHAAVDAHVAYMSLVAGKERRAICGTASGTSDSAVVPLAKAINSDRTSMVHIGCYTTGNDGYKLREPYMTAAVIAGGFAGLNPGTPMTNHSIKVQGLERKLRNPTDTDGLIRAGVMCVEDTPKGFRVVQSISTWLNDSSYDRVEVSVGCASDFTMRNVRNALDSLRGKKNDPSLLGLAAEMTDSVLRELARPEPSGPGVLAGDKDNPPYKGITASIVADQLRVSFQASFVLPNNYTLVTCYAVPFSGSVSL